MSYNYNYPYQLYYYGYPYPYSYPYPSGHGLYTPVPEQPRELPPVDTKIFEKSVHEFPKLMHDGSLLLQKLSDPAFSYRLMTASQASHQEEVNQMLKSIPTSHPIETKFTPSSVTFTLTSDGCVLHMALRWGE